MDERRNREATRIPVKDSAELVEEKIRDIFGNDYSNIRKLGSGGSGLVFTGDHKRLPRRDVIKYMKRPKGDPELDHKEADIMAITKSTGLPTVYNYVSRDDDIFIVMEYMKGESFESILKGNYAVPQDDAVRYTIDLLESLCELHSKNIVHGDINPRNVIRNSERDSAALIDFDISGYLAGDQVIVAGYSSYYAAPEQIRAFYAMQRAAGIRPENRRKGPEPLNLTEKITITGQGNTYTLSAESQTLNINGEEGADSLTMSAGAGRTASMTLTGGSTDRSVTLSGGSFEDLQREYKSYAVDQRADIYSTGAFLYRLLTGTPPAEDPAKRLPLSSFSRFSDSVEAIVAKALSQNPEDRFESARQMQEALKNYVTSDSRFRSMERVQRLIRIFLFLGIIGCGVLACFGYQRMGRETMDAYNEIVADMKETREAGDLDGLNEELQEAIGLEPDILAAQVEMARYYYQEGLYDEGISYIINDALKNGEALGSDTDRGKLYYILGCCYLEKEEYLDAQTRFGEAVSYDDTNPDYYRDFAISLARTENSEEAQKQLDIAVEKGLLEDQIALVRGEICVARHEYEDSIPDFDYCIDHTDLPYALMSAYLMKSKAYGYMGTDEEHLTMASEVLEEARARVADNYQRYILEQLSTDYIYLGNLTSDTKYCTKAIGVLQDIAGRGFASFRTYANLFYQNMRLEDYDQARIYAQTALQEYPDRYEPYMYLAWLEALAQNGLDWDHKDYTAFMDYYKKAREIYDALPAGEQTDQQMENLQQALENIEEQLRK